MKIHRLQSSLRFDKPLNHVFAFFADAHNLQQITPDWLSFKVLTPKPIAMHVGQMIDYKLRVRGLPLRWTSRIKVWEPPYRFVDEQVRGPYRAWIHEHRFTERDGMTIVEDDVRYAVLGGAFVNKLFVARDVRKIFEHRGARMKEIFRSAPDERDSIYGSP